MREGGEIRMPIEFKEVGGGYRDWDGLTDHADSDGERIEKVVNSSVRVLTNKGRMVDMAFEMVKHCGVEISGGGTENLRCQLEFLFDMLTYTVW